MSDYLLMSENELKEEKKIIEKELEGFKQKDLKLNMARGKPGDDQLDLSMDLFNIKDYIDNTGVDTRNYGFLHGAPEAREFFSTMLGVTPEETFVGGNASLQLIYFAIFHGWKTGYTETSGPWEKNEKRKFLCPAPGYDRHFRITESLGFELITVDMTPNGPDMDAVEELVKDPDVKGIWCVPVYSNPDGYTYSDETVERLAKMDCAADDFRIMWDNAYGYHHLTDEHESCPNMLDACKKAGNTDRAMIFMSTSKMTFPGAGISVLGASENNIKQFHDELFVTTICYDKINQLHHVRFFEQAGGIAKHMEKHAALLRPKFKMVIDTFNKNLGSCGEIATWTDPKGGYFISLYTLEGCAKDIVALCKELGVILTGAGAAYPYGDDPKDYHIRIAPTYPPLDELRNACELLCAATRYVSVNKLLAQKN